MIQKFFATLISICFFCSLAKADELWLKNISTAKLNELYQQIGYTGITEKSWLMLPSKRYPAVFLKKFPADFAKIEDSEQRNSLFIKIMAPLALKLNQDILKERQLILDIDRDFKQNQKISSTQLKTLEEKAAKYDVFTRLKDNERTDFLISELLKRIDIISPSIMISLAAIETDFGSSRIVKEGNSLYKVLQWHTQSGLKPIGEDENADYRIKTYPDIYQAIKDFALRINSNINFDFFRTARAEIHSSTNPEQLIGKPLIAYAFTNSELKNYAGIIEYILSYYELFIIDQSTLDTTAITKQIIKKYAN
ncbi:MAG: glucosaminidase domain-containing protein [Alphaproteobacteria bacterium]|nr:glucosaminidase domain-containing protein [Alphaproteobacteria bacterium]